MYLNKSISIVTVMAYVFIALLYSGTASAWYSAKPRETHYKFTLLSKNLLKDKGLFFADKLKQGSKSPDKDISGIRKALQHHQHEKRVRINLNTSIQQYKNGEYQKAAVTLASAFHYLQDAIDFSHKHKKHEDKIRREAHELLRRSTLQTGYRMKIYKDTYHSEYEIMRNFSNKRIVRRMQDKQKDYKNEIQPHLNEQYADNRLNVISKVIGTLQAAQDIIISRSYQPPEKPKRDREEQDKRRIGESYWVWMPEYGKVVCALDRGTYYRIWTLPEEKLLEICGPRP